MKIIRNYVLTLALSFTFLVPFARESKSVELKSFSKLSISDYVNAKMVKSTENKVVFEADEKEDLEKFKIEIVGNSLHVKGSNDRGLIASLFGDAPTATIYYTGTIDEINCDKNSILTVNDDINTSNFKANCSNGSEINLQKVIATNVNITLNIKSKIKANIKSDLTNLFSAHNSVAKIQIESKQLKTNCIRNSDVCFKGTVEKANHKGASLSTICANELVTKEVDVRSHTTCEIELNVTERLHAQANSNSKITYKGNPENLVKTVNSNGIIEKAI
jgi:hypothetical protein